MNYDKRIGLPCKYSLFIEDEKTGNKHSIIIGEEIGRGGSCIVYEGVQLDNVGNEDIERKIIIKEFYPKAFDEIIKRSTDQELIIPEDVVEHFENRLALFRKGQIEHISFANDNSEETLHPISFSGECHHTFYAVSYANEGSTLAEKNRDKISLVDALKISESLCKAIARLHLQKKMYLDCKPENIWCYGNRAYLFDFDTVQVRGRRLEFCSYSDGWSAPEQIIYGAAGYKDYSKIGFHTDMFSIGAVLFYLLVGRKPTNEDIESIQKGYNWADSISLKDETNALKDSFFLDELSCVMGELLQPDVDVRKARLGREGISSKVSNDFRHLLSLAENTSYRIGFKETNENIANAREDIKETIKKHSIKNLLFGSKRRLLATISSFVVLAVLIGVLGSLGGKLVDTVIPDGTFATEKNMESHILIKLSNANHQYEVGLENWRRMDYNRAEESILEARNSISEEKSQAETEVAKINNSLGCLYLDMGRYEDSYDYLNNAYITFRDTYGEDAEETLSVLFSVAQYDYYSGDIETALKSLQKILDITDEEDDVAIAVSAQNFRALIYDALGDYDSAISSYRSILEMFDDILSDGEMTEELVNYVNDSALTQSEKDRYTSALRWIILTSNNLGETYIRAEKYEEAEKILSAALKVSLDNMYIGTKDLTTSKIYMNLAKLYEQQGDVKKGIDNIDLAMRIQKNLFDFEGVYPGLVEVYDIYGDLLVMKNENEEAGEYYSDAVELAEASFGINHPSTAETYNAIGEFYLEEGKTSEAKTKFSEAIEIRRNILGYKNIRTVQYIFNSAIAEITLGNNDKAVELLTEARELCEELGVSGSIFDEISELYNTLAR